MKVRWILSRARCYRTRPCAGSIGLRLAAWGGTLVEIMDARLAIEEASARMTAQVMREHIRESEEMWQAMVSVGAQRNMRSDDERLMCDAPASLQVPPQNAGGASHIHRSFQLLSLQIPAQRSA